MFWYLFLSTSPVWIALIVQGFYKQSVDSPTIAKKVYIVACSIVVFLMIALRHYSLGSTDSMNYYAMWIDLNGASTDLLRYFMEASRVEDTYIVTIWVLSKIFIHPQFLFVLSGMLFSIAVGRFIYKNSDNVVLSFVMFICLGLYTFMVQGLRQSIAISICLFAIEYCKRRKLIRFLILVFLASLFHRTAVVFFLVYFLYGAKFDIKTKVFMFIIPVALFSLMPIITSISNEMLDRDYNTAAETGSAIVASLIHVLILGFAYIYLNEKNSGKKETFFIAFAMLGASFYLMRYIGTQAYERISFYFLMGRNIVLPDVVKRFNQKSQNIINLVVIVLSIALFIYRLNTSYLVPYLFFWQR